MKRWVIGSILATIVILQAGCGDGIARTRRDRMHHYRRGFEQDMRMLVDDFDDIMLNDRPSRLSNWRVK